MPSSFTIKDFLTYYTPCFCCGEDPYVMYDIKDKSDNHHYEINSNGINVNINKIKVIYKTTYIKDYYLIIDLNTNTYHVSDVKDFLTFKQNNSIKFYIHCNYCTSTIRSSFCEFKDQYIKPIHVVDEILYFKNNEQNICIDTSKNKTIIEIFTDNLNIETTSINVKDRNLFLSQFKTKEDIIKKIKLLKAFV